MAGTWLGDLVDSVGDFAEGTLDTVGGVYEKYTDYFQADNAGASPAVHDQNKPAVTPHGQPIRDKKGALDYLNEYWLYVVLALVALFAVIALIKWVA